MVGREFAGERERLIEEVESPGIVVEVAPKESTLSASDCSSSSLRGSGRGAKRIRRMLAGTLFVFPSELEATSSEEAVEAALDADCKTREEGWFD